MPYIKAAEYRKLMEKIERLSSQPAPAPAAPAPVAGQKDFSALRKKIADCRMATAQEVIEAAMRTPVVLYAKHQGQQAFTMTDSQIRVVSKELLDEILKETEIDLIQWQSEVYDCANISQKFVSRLQELGYTGSGRVLSWSGGHAFGICIVEIDGQLEFVFVEPQTDAYISEGNGLNEGKYKMDDCLIVIG